MLNVLYMGTPDFAVPALEALINGGYNVSAVVTQPDKPKGRGMKMTSPPVKELAEKNEIPVYQPQTLKNNELLPVLDKHKPDVIIVVAYGKILPEYVLEYPKYGCINVHGSLLPKYRGAAPIQKAVIDGEATTGVCTMYMDKGLDTGDVLLTKETPIGEKETAEELFDRLAPLGAQVLIETLSKIQSGNIERTKQNDSLATYAPPIKKEDAKIDWSLSAKEIDCLIRGCYSWPVAYTFCDDIRIKIIKGKIGSAVNGLAGTVLNVNNEGMTVAAGDGKSIIIEEFQPEGSKRMSPDAYFRGHQSMIGKTLK